MESLETSHTDYWHARSSARKSIPIPCVPWPYAVTEVPRAHSKQPTQPLNLLAGHCVLTGLTNFVVSHTACTKATGSRSRRCHGASLNHSGLRHASFSRVLRPQAAYDRHGRDQPARIFWLWAALSAAPGPDTVGSGTCAAREPARLGVVRRPQAGAG